MDRVWLLIGLLGQALFFMRFAYQWIQSERAKRSIVPEAFWYFSIGGGVILLAYAIYQRDPVFIIGQAGGLLIYARNIMLVWREKQRAAQGGDVRSA
jgi:lipid-A-disaccharide synthase-like uncharacterized protein